MLDHANFLFATPFYPSLAFPTPRNRRTRRAVERIDEIIYKIIADRRRLEHAIYRSALPVMEARDEENGEGMSDRQLHDEVLTIFIAGHETTAVALTWCLYLLSQHPDVERRLRGRAGGGNWAGEHQRSTIYQRSHTPARCWMKRCGYTLPPGLPTGARWPMMRSVVLSSRPILWWYSVPM